MISAYPTKVKQTSRKTTKRNIIRENRPKKMTFKYNNPLISTPKIPLQKQIEPVKILPFLYIGNQTHATNEGLLRRLKITNIINCTTHVENKFEDFIEYTNVPVLDNDHSIDTYFNISYRQIEEVRRTSGRILVHCEAGISRSTTIVISYIIRRYNMSFKNAFKYVANKHPFASPNIYFIGQLIKYQKQLLHKKYIAFILSLGLFLIMLLYSC